MFKYILLFLLLPLYSTSQCLKANISILMDWSSSEYGSEEDIAGAAHDFIHELAIGEDQVKISLTTFSMDTSGSYYTFVPLSGNIKEIDLGLNQLASYRANGGTYLSDALIEGLYQIRSDGRNDVYNVIIIISDGEIFDSDYSSLLVYAHKKDIPNLSVFAVQIGNLGLQLPMAPMLSPQNPIQLHRPEPSSNVLSPISDEGYKALAKICGGFSKVSISSTSELTKGLKKLDLCM